MTDLARAITSIHTEKVMEVARNLELGRQKIKEHKKEYHYSAFRVCTCEMCTMSCEDQMQQQKRYALQAVENAKAERDFLLELISAE